MKPIRVNLTSANFDDGTYWPLPDHGDDEHECLEWILRYGTPSKSQLLRAAEVLSAYGALIDRPQRRRNEIVTAIREALEIRQLNAVKP